MEWGENLPFPASNICCTNLITEDQLKWYKVEMKGQIPKKSRFGHSLNCYKKLFIIFGGINQLEPNKNYMECLSDLRVFNTENNEWKIIGQAGEFIQPRRNHSAVVIGKHLLVYGGVDTRDHYMNDVWHLDLSNHPLSGHPSFPTPSTR